LQRYQGRKREAGEEEEKESVEEVSISRKGEDLYSAKIQQESTCLMHRSKRTVGKRGMDLKMGKKRVIGYRS